MQRFLSVNKALTTDPYKYIGHMQMPVALGLGAPGSTLTWIRWVKEGNRLLQWEEFRYSVIRRELLVVLDVVKHFRIFTSVYHVYGTRTKVKCLKLSKLNFKYLKGQLSDGWSSWAAPQPQYHVLSRQETWQCRGFVPPAMWGLSSLWAPRRKREPAQGDTEAVGDSRSYW